MLCCILTLFSGCKEDEENPLRFYNSEYEVPMGGRRYLGLESGNGDYSLEVKDTRIASARVDALYFLLSYNLYFIFILLTISVLSIVYVDYFPYLYKIL